MSIYLRVVVYVRVVSDACCLGALVVSSAPCIVMMQLLEWKGIRCWSAPMISKVFVPVKRQGSWSARFLPGRFLKQG